MFFFRFFCVFSLYTSCNFSLHMLPIFRRKNYSLKELCLKITKFFRNSTNSDLHKKKKVFLLQILPTFRLPKITANLIICAKVLL